MTTIRWYFLFLCLFTIGIHSPASSSQSNPTICPLFLMYILFLFLLVVVDFHRATSRQTYCIDTRAHSSISAWLEKRLRRRNGMLAFVRWVATVLISPSVFVIKGHWRRRSECTMTTAVARLNGGSYPGTNTSNSCLFISILASIRDLS